VIPVSSAGFEAAGTYNLEVAEAIANKLGYATEVGGQLTINPKTITLDSTLAATTREYDGTTKALFTGKVEIPGTVELAEANSGDGLILALDDVTATVPADITGAFSSKDVDEDNRVDFGNLLQGDDAANYHRP
jgi:hypothetical protein